MAINTTYDPGRMDRRVLLQVPTTSKQANGERTETWADYDWRWAELASTSAGETSEGEMIIVATSATFRLRFDAVINETYRLIYRNRIYNILGINEIDRRRYMDLTCEAGDMFKPFTADTTEITADADTVTADLTMF